MAASILRWSFIFMTVSMMVHTYLVLSRTIWIARDDVTDVFPRMRCAKLTENFFSRSASKIDLKSISESVRELMSCPQKVNVTQRERYRLELKACCNASGDMILTQENTHLGQKIIYETDRKKTRLVDKSVFNMLPESIPWRNQSKFRHCSVVGNGGILKNSSCGAQIDSADFIIRMNLAPINNSVDVGVKTNLITINPSQIRVGYPNLKKSPEPLADRVSAYGNAPLLLSAFTYTFCTELSFQVHRALRSLRPQQKVVFFNPEYLLQLDRYWKQHRGLKEIRLTTGLMLASVGLELCDEVDLYGFWPFGVDLLQRPLSHHYYDNMGPSKRMHAMPKEFLQLLRMHSQGVIRMHLGACQ
ncbi:alpha-2,8-sialyltransferase 8F-like isoform X1 [Megalops cyprinoides]|uniref:alpha-2,8-sialyltransferase 8F-like isoform X1 n=1 Tax=Megalops cyprinoides TaxID=118141 RepID=UPI001864CD53|nr:alpha-2,8-sialyltransferase 8F-like isoform X1 [Megalops cyprinoides]